MNDDEARARLAAATEVHRQRIATGDATPSPKPITSIASIARRTVRELPRPNPDAPDDPAYRKPEPITRAPDARPHPVTAGPSEWSQVAPLLQQQILSAIGDKRWPIYIFGPAGVGKTCAADCVYQGWTGSALWYEAGRIVADIIECRTNATGTVTRRRDGASWEEGEQTIIRKIGETSLLVLNDVGLRTPSDAVYEILMGMIDLRLHKPLIVTSNLHPDDLVTVYDDRIESRLLRGTVIQVIGDDRRKASAKFVSVRTSPAHNANARSQPE